MFENRQRLVIEGPCGSLLVLGLEGDGAGTASLHEGCLVGFEHAEFNLGLLVTAYAGLLLDALDAAFHRLEVLQLELRVDDFFVANGIYRAIDVYDVRIIETAEDVDDGITFAYVSEELVTEALALGGAFDESGDIDNLACRRDDATGMNELG